MTVAAWLLLVVLVIIVGAYVERTLARRRGSPSLSRPVTQRLDAAGQQVQQYGKQLVQSPYMAHSPSLRTWVQQHEFADRALQKWLLDLPQRSFDALIVQLGEFLYELNIELEWLVSDDLNADPALRASIEQITVEFFAVCRKATSVQTDLSGVQQYAETLERLTDRKLRQFSQRLLAELHANQLISTVDADILVAGPRKRYAYLQQLITEATEKDRVRFQQIFDQVLLETQNR